MVCDLSLFVASRKRKPLNFLRRSQQAVPHQRLGGRYKVINQLGVGGFSQTFLAEDLHLPGHPLCVVKQFKPQVVDPVQLQTASRLFDTEAKVLYQLGEHPQIPRLLAHFEEEQEFYLVQEFVEGQPLAKLLTGQPWSEPRVLALLQDLLHVLVFVHQQSVIHRDIKPSNLICRNQDQRIVLIDFGAVKQVSTQLTESSTGLLTVSIGTQGYMPMEQLSGNPRFSSDIYATGVVGIQALTGLSPKRFKSDLQTGEIVWRDLRLSAGGQAAISPAFAAILDRMVCYHFKDRYQTAAETLQALEALLAERPDLAEPNPAPLPTVFTVEQIVTLNESALLSESDLPESDLAESEGLAEPESALPLSQAFVDEPTQTFVTPQALPNLAAAPQRSSLTELTDDPVADDPVTDPATDTDSDPATEANPDTDPASIPDEGSVFPTAFAPDPIHLAPSPDPNQPDASPTPDRKIEPNGQVASPMPSSWSAAAVQPEAQPNQPSQPTPQPNRIAEPPPEPTESVSELVPTTHVAPIAFVEEPSTTWQRSRFLPWLLVGAVAVVVAIPFFSRFLQPQAQSGIRPAALADLPCREPAPPPLPSGKFDYQYPDGTRYYGSVKQGLPVDGRAVMLFPSGNRYDGEFQNGQRNGCGTLTFSNGRSYMGQFKDDQFDGQGVWTLETGDRYIGSFANNRCHGEGTFLFGNGSSKQGRWQDGKLVNGDLQCDQ